MRAMLATLFVLACTPDDSPFDSASDFFTEVHEPAEACGLDTCSTASVTVPVFEPSLGWEVEDAIAELAGAGVPWGDPDELMPYAEMVEAFVADADEARVEFADDRWLGPAWELDVRVEVIMDEGDVLSLAGHQSSYTGGAHGNYGTQLRSIDLATGHAIALTDIVEEWALDDLTYEGQRQFELDDVPLDELWFENGEFELSDEFAIHPDGLLFYWAPYAIGPWSAGDFEIVIPWRDIDDLLVTDGVLSTLSTG
jgi:hypothetical protein